MTLRAPASSRGRFALTPPGTVTRTKASPPDTRSARLESTWIRGACERALAGAAHKSAIRQPISTAPQRRARPVQAGIAVISLPSHT